MRKSLTRNTFRNPNSPASLDPLEPRRLLAADVAAVMGYTPGTYYPGMPVGGVMLDEFNVGSGTNAADFSTRVVLSTDRVYGNSDDIEVAVSRRGDGDASIAPGRVARRELPFTIGSSVPSGNYYLMARVDSLGELAEASEANNTWCSTAPDLVVTRATISVTSPDQTASEAGNNTGRFRVTRTGPTTSPQVVRYTLSGTATAEGDEADYAELTGAITIPAGQSTVLIVIRPVDDNRIEGPERVTVTLSSDDAYTLATQSTSRLDIFDNDGPKIRLTATDATANEQDTATATFTISRTNDLSSDLTVRYTTSGTAGAGNDYEALSGTVVIPNGQTSVTITLTPTDDREGEGNETVVLTLVEDPSYITVAGRRTARANIVDNEPVVKILATDAVASEDGTNTATFTVSRQGSSVGDLVVAYTLSGTATATGDAADFAALTGTVTIPSGQFTARIVVTPSGDHLAEPTESLTLILTAAMGFKLDTARNRATATIRDVSPEVSITTSDATATETNTTTGAFVVRRTGTPTGELVVGYTISGTATSGTDFVPLTGTVTILDTDSSATILLTPIDDRIGEGSETVIVTLSTGASYQRSATRQIGRINIADNEPAVSIIATDAQAGEAAGQTGLFTISRAGTNTGPLTVLFTIGGTATASGDGVTSPDYTAIGTGATGSVTIPDSAASITILVTPTDDATAETSETVTLTLTGTDGYVISTSRRSATVTIADDEPVVSIAATDPSANETRTDTDAGTALFTITRVTAGTSDLTVLFTIGGTAANDGSDFTAITSSATILAGQTTATVPITPVDDALGESDETVILTLATNSAYTIASGAGRDRATATIRDNEPIVRIQATDNTATEQDETTATFTFTRVGTAAQLELPFTLSYNVEGTADSGDDYEPLEGVVEFGAGVATVTLTFSAIDDTNGEGNETVILSLEGGGAYAVDPSKAGATVTITDNEGIVSIIATDAAAGEYNNTGTFTISRTGSTTEALFVPYTITGTATATDDYTALSAYVLIEEGASSATVTITPVYDLLTEDAENVILTLGAGEGYRVDPVAARCRATVTIANAQAVDLGAGGVSYFAGDYSLASTDIQVPIVVNMTNAGAAAAGVFRYEVRLSLNTIWGDDDDIVIWTSSQRELDAGASTTANGTVSFDSIKSRLSAGSYYVGLKLDVAASVVERNRTDNTWWSGGADFVVTA